MRLRIADKIISNVLMGRGNYTESQWQRAASKYRRRSDRLKRRRVCSRR